MPAHRKATRHFTGRARGRSVLTKAVVRAAASARISRSATSPRILGVSEATASRLFAEKYRLVPAARQGVGAGAVVRAAVPLARRALGTRRVARTWLRSPNVALAAAAARSAVPPWRDSSVSSGTWTPRAVASETRALRRPCLASSGGAAHRLDHGAGRQRSTSSMCSRVCSTRASRRCRAGARALDYLLFTPFRYAPPPGGSRFRGETDPGVLYCADEVRTACAELGYWRWRHLLDSAGAGRHACP